MTSVCSLAHRAARSPAESGLIFCLCFVIIFYLLTILLDQLSQYLPDRSSANSRRVGKTILAVATKFVGTIHRIGFVLRGTRSASAVLDEGKPINNN